MRRASRRVGALAAFACVLGVAAARGDGEGPKPAASNLDCGQLMACSDACGLECSGISKFSCLLGCKERCQKLGCQQASAAFEELSGCMKSHCPFACAGGPGEKCRKCGVEDCPEPRNACTSQRCATQEPPDAGGLAPADAGGK